MNLFSRIKNEAAVIRRIFKGEPDAYRHIVERYQPMVYAVALANTGNVYLADKVVVESFLEGFNRLVSLADPKRLGTLLCSLAQGKADEISGKQTSEGKRPRPRGNEAPPVDLKFIQSELMEPLIEEMGSFSVRERKGLLLHTFCGMSAKQIADVLRIERKEAEEDLARTRENIERALLKEIKNALQLEVNSKERFGFIMTEVAGSEAATQAMSTFRAGKQKGKALGLVVGAAIVLVLLTAGYFGYRALKGITAVSQTQENSVVSGDNPLPMSTEGEEDVAAKSVMTPTNYVLSGRVVDSRFIEDGIAGVKVSAGTLQAETDFYGAFEIKGVTKGQHEVSVSAGGVVLRSGIRLSTEERNNPITIRVNANVPARFRFHGRVFDRVSNQVISQFEVASCKDYPDMLQPYMMKAFQEQSHSEGLLSDRFTTLGEYTMYVRARGYAPLPVRFSIDENWDEGYVFEIGLYRATALEGIVYGANELSVAGAAIMPRQGTAYGTALGEVNYVLTDSMGRFALYTLPVGVQSFIIYHINHGTGRAILELEAGKTKKISVQMPKRGSLTGDITLDSAPTQFKEYRRRLSGSGIDLTKNISYIASGQYEITLTPEPVVIWASVAPRNVDQWFDRRLEREAVIDMNEPTWLDFNFNSGSGEISGTVSLRGGAARSAFVEVVYSMSRSNDKDRFFYNISASNYYRLSNLPYGSGEITVYAAPRSINENDFLSTRTLMDKRSSAFVLDASNNRLLLDFAL